MSTNDGQTYNCILLSNISNQWEQCLTSGQVLPRAAEIQWLIDTDTRRAWQVILASDRPSGVEWDFQSCMAALLLPLDCSASFLSTLQVLIPDKHSEHKLLPWSLFSRRYNPLDAKGQTYTISWMFCFLEK